MKIGVRAHDFGCAKAGTLAGILKDNGFEAAQLAAPKGIEGIGSYRAMGEEAACEIGRAFEEKGIEITVLGCYIDMSNPDPDINENHMAEFLAAMERMKALGARMIGTETTYGKISMEQKQAAWPLILKNMDRIMNRAEALGVRVAVEPVEYHALYSPERTRKLLDAIDSRRLGIIFDPINMLTPDRVNQQEQVWQECYDAFGDAIAAVHLKDGFFDGQGNYNPCRLGSGITEYGAMFDWLRLHKPEICILREEEQPEYAGEDVEFMRRLAGK